MTTNNETTDEQVGTPAPTETPAVSPETGQDTGDKGRSFDQAEYTRKTQKLAVLKQRAIEAGFDDPEEYLNELEYAISSAQKTPDTEKPPETKPDESGGMTALQQQIAELKKTQAMITKQNTIVMMNAMYSDYNREQRELDAEQKFGFSKTELNNFMLDRRNASIIGDVAREEEAKGESANWYKIAAEMMDYKKSRAAIKKEGANQQEALNAAAESAKAMGTTSIPAKKEEKKTPAQIKAERLAPDSRQKF